MYLVRRYTRARHPPRARVRVIACRSPDQISIPALGFPLNQDLVLVPRSLKGLEYFPPCTLVQSNLPNSKTCKSRHLRLQAVQQLRSASRRNAADSECFKLVP